MSTAGTRGPLEQFGEFLRGARESRGMTLQYVSQATKIPTRHLEALERGHLSIIPEGPYRRGEVRAFAQTVGLDQHVAIAHLEQALDAVAPKDETPAPLPREPIDLTRATPFVTLAAVLALTLLLIWSRPSGVSSAAPEASVSSAPAEASASNAPAEASISRAVPSESVPSRVATRMVPLAEATSEPQRAPETPSSSVLRRVTATAPVPLPAVAADMASALEATPSSPEMKPAAPAALLVTSDPPGSRVVVDGIGRGTTPVAIQYLPPGAKHLRIVHDGYVSEERTVRVAPDAARAAVHVELQRME